MKVKASQETANTSDMTDQPSAPSSTPDRSTLGQTYNFAANRLGQDFSSSSGGKKILGRVPIRKPNRAEFIRTHKNFVHATMILEAPDQSGVFMVDTPLWPHLEGDLKAKLLVPFINRKNDVALWPISAPDTTRSNLWTDSAMQAATTARDSWVRLAANMNSGAYDIYEAEAVIAEPIWPEGVEDVILGLAFSNRVIMDLDHPVILKLRGKI